MMFNPLFTMGIYMLDVLYKAWYCEGLTVLEKEEKWDQSGG